MNTLERLAQDYKIINNTMPCSDDFDDFYKQVYDFIIKVESEINFHHISSWVNIYPEESQIIRPARIAINYGSMGEYTIIIEMGGRVKLEVSDDFRVIETYIFTIDAIGLEKIADKMILVLNEYFGEEQEGVLESDTWIGLNDVNMTTFAIEDFPIYQLSVVKDGDLRINLHCRKKMSQHLFYTDLYTMMEDYRRLQKIYFGGETKC